MKSFLNFFTNIFHNIKQPSGLRIENRDGKLEITGLNAWYDHWRDPYHLLLMIPWRGFLLLVALFYLLINSFFALLYLVNVDGIAGGQQPITFSDTFFFSVQTLASIGYGALNPVSLYTNLIVTLESLTSLLLLALVTGISFARFTKSTARVIFSESAVVAPYNGVPTLMFRAANERRNYILEARMQAYLMLDQVSTEGEYMRRLYELPLLRSHSPTFTLSWTAMHVIDAQSPLYGLTATELTHGHGQILVSLTGVDESIGSSIHARHIYGHQSVLWNHRLQDIVQTYSDGSRFMDYQKFHHVVPIEPDIESDLESVKE
ncbi:MAG: ion channel [Pseudanabaenaceae cyanobacterium]|jgi:inward rectifier potassium channel